MSAASRAPGKQRARDESAGQGGGARSPERAGSEPLEITLDHARWRHLTWAIVGLAAGCLLVMKLSTVGKVIGVGLMAAAVYHGYCFVRTLLSPAGTIRVSSAQVTLPVGLCRGEGESFSADDVRHAFLLRRAVSWTTTAPVLIIEVGERVFAYPRDWFAADADQRRVARAIHALHGRQSGS